ncbi:MAG TPA: Asp-tRNA(Asn)/Glu-tRNA(Gln) amidotransferase subunit GatA [bacterium]|nr:Asp-tRNA(Asn)/Glu-tRNA(Gln) amidotransferase subunit GatA [bacterium]
MTARQVAAAVASGETTAAAVVDRCLERIAAHDGSLGAFCGTFAARARRTAAAIDDRIRAGETPGPLAGVPIANKDTLLVAGERATAGSRMLAKFTAPYTASSLTRLERHDAVLIGRTNMDEFGMGSTTESSSCQRTYNPFGRGLVPGGSSGGSAAAVAADLCPLAIGSDTGGSVRQPAALCGVTGLKPTYGRVSRYGLIAYASSLDCVGAIARTAEDLALWLDSAGGNDPADATTLPPEGPTSTLLPALARRDDLRGLRLGIAAELNGPDIDPQVLASTTAAVDRLRELGAELVTCTVPTARHAVPAYYLLATAEASSNLARYDGVHYGFRHRSDRERPGDSHRRMTTDTRSQGFGPEVQLRILLGTFATSIGYSDRFYERARLARRAVRRDFARAFAGCDAIVCPTSPTPAPRFGEHADDPLQRYRWDALTVPASLAGIPALSMPVAPTPDGRPVGLQVMTPHGHDERALQIAHVFQQHTDHHLRRPRLADEGER